MQEVQAQYRAGLQMQCITAGAAHVDHALPTCAAATERRLAAALEAREDADAVEGATLLAEAAGLAVDEYCSCAVVWLAYASALVV